MMRANDIPSLMPVEQCNGGSIAATEWVVKPSPLTTLTKPP